MGISLILGLTIYQKVTAEERIAQSYIEELEMAKTTENLLGLILEKIMDNSLTLALDEKIEELLETNSLGEEDYLKPVVDHWLMKNTEIDSVHLMDLERNLFTSARISTTNHNEEAFKAQFTEADLRKIDEKEGQAYIGIGKDFINQNSEKTLYIARKINSVDLRKIGYLYIFLDRSVLEEKLKDYLDRNHFTILLADIKGNTLYFVEGKALDKLYTDYMTHELDKKERRAFESLFHHAEIESKMLQLKLIGERTSSKIDVDLINIIVAISFINLIFLGIGILVMKEIVIDPLEKIASNAKQITNEGSLAIRFDTNQSYREANLINETLNEMLNRIDELIEEAKEKERVQRMLELSVINHQVNPHFLFNTLNSVNVLITVEDKVTASQLVKSLAKYYRACLSQESDANTIDQELAIMNEYVHITMLKNPDLIRTKVCVEEGLYNKKIPRMILQTLVENSIKYGIKTIEEPLEIEISIRGDYKGKCTILSVRDNGNGMTEEIKWHILERGPLEGKSGFGLSAAVKRISLMYEGLDIKDILEIDSKLNEYTKITLYIPWETNKNVQQAKLFKKHE